VQVAVADHRLADVGPAGLEPLGVCRKVVPADLDCLLVQSSDEGHGVLVLVVKGAGVDAVEGGRVPGEPVRKAAGESREADQGGGPRQVGEEGLALGELHEHPCVVEVGPGSGGEAYVGSGVAVVGEMGLNGGLTGGDIGVGHDSGDQLAPEPLPGIGELDAPHLGPETSGEGLGWPGPGERRFSGCAADCAEQLIESGLVVLHTDTIDCISDHCQDNPMPTVNQAGAEWTIDELAVDAGVPVRTIREYQRLELLPPPRREGRVGRYGSEHRARLSIIDRLQERGYSLAAIGDLIGSWELGRGLGSVLGVDANPAVLDEAPAEISAAQLEQLVPEIAEPRFVKAADAAGLIRSVDDDTFVVRSLAAVELVGLAIEAGMPPAAAIEMVSGIRTGAAAVASAVVDQMVEHLWPRRGVVDLSSLFSRARLLLAQASASMVVHELGVALDHQADLEDAGELRELIDRVTIGQVRRLPSAPSNEI
jgi:DNA-binding transcriptional MerR regulator